MCKFNIVFLILLVGGCSTPKTFITNIQPEDHEIIEKKPLLFEQSKEATWNDLLTMFANSEFRIDRINMNARMVTLRYRSQPDLYIDCGIKRINTEGNEITIINTKSHYSYRAYQHIHLETYSVNNDFTGYVNLLITGNDISSQVSVQFDLELETEEKRTTTRGIRFSTNRNDKLKLNSLKPMYSKLFKTNCRTTGKLERQVFEMISQMYGSRSPLR